MVSKNEIAIKAENLSKQYKIGVQRQDTLRDAIVNALPSFTKSNKNNSSKHLSPSGDSWQESSDTIWALKDVSFEIKRGEVVGIIGRNGAGKTTPLKILSRITEPTSGRAIINGRVGSLLEVGTGFHPELTGRENIFLNGAILGMHRSEIEHKFDEIVAFSEIEKFLDTPVKRYSSGMYVRLAFAVAAHLDPEILLVDEVLAVGDISFQNKCLGKMGNVAKEGRTVLFVSHNLSAIDKLCSNAILIKDGILATSGVTNRVIRNYLSTSSVKNQGFFILSDVSRNTGTGEAKIISFKIRNVSLKLTSTIQMGDGVVFEIEYFSTISLKHASFQIGLYTNLMQPICLFNSDLTMFSIKDNTKYKKGIVKCSVEKLNLTSGRYYFNLAITDLLSGKPYDHLYRAAYIDITAKDVFKRGKQISSHTPCFFYNNWSLK